MKEWASKEQISRENTISRRYSASYIRSFREETRSFRSNITISSTASSPGYPFRDEIDPSNYSFTSALKALQARSGYTNWECLSPEGFALNSKWNEAEKYICNPLSGEFPIECLSARTLSGRSFHKLTNRITVSAPLVYSSRNIKVKPSIFEQEDMDFASTVSEKKSWRMTRDAGTQSTLPYFSSSIPSPSSSPSITDHTTKQCWDSPNSNSNLKSLQEVEGKETRSEAAEDGTKTVPVQEEQLFRRGGCFSWVRSRRQRKKQTRERITSFSIILNFI